MLVCNLQGRKYPIVADNFFITVNKNCSKAADSFLNINENKNCLQDTFCVRDYVAVSRCFCHGGVPYPPKEGTTMTYASSGVKIHYTITIQLHRIMRIRYALLVITPRCFANDFVICIVYCTLIIF